MIKNNIELDVKVKCIEQGTTQTQIAEDIGTTKSYVNRSIKKPEGVVNKTFVQMMESLGYDIELTYMCCALEERWQNWIDGGTNDEISFYDRNM